MPLSRLFALLLFMLAGAGVSGQARAETAVFAGGCFWCVESDFDQISGVTSTVSGYVGGTLRNPTYKQVSAGGTGHYEAVQVTFNPAKVSYEQLVDAFFHSVDVTDAGGQFCDRGASYRTAIFAQSDEQKKVAENVKARTAKALGRNIVTPIKSAATFYPAEDYHQNYYRKNPVRYKYYRYSCGRDKRVKALWGKDAYKGIPGHS